MGGPRKLAVVQSCLGSHSTAVFSRRRRPGGEARAMGAWLQWNTEVVMWSGQVCNLTVIINTYNLIEP
jgi:hypothetical protein